MTPMMLTYILLFVSGLLLITQYVQYNRNKKRGYATTLKPFHLIAMMIVFVLALYATLTNQSYEEVLSLFR